MDIQLKQRLIGTIVFFTLVIIFLPLAFDFDSNEHELDQLLIPLTSENSIPVNGELQPAVHKSNNKINNKPEEKQANKQTDRLNELLAANNSNFEHVVKSESEQDQKQIEADIATATKLVEELQKKILQKEKVKLEKITTGDHVSEAAKATEDKKLDTSSANTNANLDSSLDSSLDTGTDKIISNSTKKNKKTIKYSLSSNNLETNEIYAIKISSAKNRQAADKIKDLMLSMGFPAYSSHSADDYAIYIGPDLELKYIKELANRVLDETDYQPEIITHSKTWLAAN